MAVARFPSLLRFGPPARVPAPRKARRGSVRFLPSDVLLGGLLAAAVGGGAWIALLPVSAFFEGMRTWSVAAPLLVGFAVLATMGTLAWALLRSRDFNMGSGALLAALALSAVLHVSVLPRPAAPPPLAFARATGAVAPRGGR